MSFLKIYCPCDLVNSCEFLGGALCIALKIGSVLDQISTINDRRARFQNKASTQPPQHLPLSFSVDAFQQSNCGQNCPNYLTTPPRDVAMVRPDQIKHSGSRGSVPPAACFKFVWRAMASANGGEAPSAENGRGKRSQIGGVPVARPPLGPVSPSQAQLIAIQINQMQQCGQIYVVNQLNLQWQLQQQQELQ